MDIAEHPTEEIRKELEQRLLERTCPICKKYFILRNLKQKYCTTKCSEVKQRECKRNWWRMVGSKNRRKRRAGMSISTKSKKLPRSARNHGKVVDAWHAVLSGWK